MLALLLLGPVALAHTEASDSWGHQLELFVEDEQVVAELVVEVPVRAAVGMLAEYLKGVEDPGPEDQERFDADFRKGLVQDLRIEVDGQPLSWTVLPAEGGGSTDPRFVAWRVRVGAELPEDPQRIRVVNGAFPDERRVVYRDLVWVADELALLESSLLVPRGERIVAVDGQWLSREELREVELRVRRRSALAATLHRAWRWLREAPAEHFPLAPHARVLVGHAEPLVELAAASSVEGTGWRSFVLALLLGIPAAFLPQQGAAWAGLAMRPSPGAGMLVMVGALLGMLVCLLLAPESAVVAGQITSGLLLLVAAGLAWRGRGAWLAALAAGLAPTMELARGLAVAGGSGRIIQALLMGLGHALALGAMLLLVAALKAHLPRRRALGIAVLLALGLLRLGLAILDA